MPQAGFLPAAPRLRANLRGWNTPNAACATKVAAH